MAGDMAQSCLFGLDILVVGARAGAVRRQPV